MEDVVHDGVGHEIGDHETFDVVELNEMPTVCEVALVDGAPDVEPDVG